MECKESGFQLTDAGPPAYERYMVPVHCEVRAKDLLDRVHLQLIEPGPGLDQRPVVVMDPPEVVGRECPCRARVWVAHRLVDGSFHCAGGVLCRRLVAARLVHREAPAQDQAKSTQEDDRAHDSSRLSQTPTHHPRSAPFASALVAAVSLHCSSITDRRRRSYRSRAVPVC